MVMPAPLVFTVPAESESVPLGRRRLARWMPKHFRCGEDALMVLSELLTNAVRHGAAGRSVEVLVECRDSGLQVRVDNEGGGVPMPRSVLASDEHGHGLVLVAGLSREWSYQQRSTGPDCSITSAWAIVPYESS